MDGSSRPFFYGRFGNSCSLFNLKIISKILQLVMHLGFFWSVFEYLIFGNAARSKNFTQQSGFDIESVIAGYMWNLAHF